MADSSCYPAHNLSHNLQAKTPPCFLYLFNTWSIAVFFLQFSFVFARQSKLAGEDLPTRELFSALPLQQTPATLKRAAISPASNPQA